MRKRSPAAPSKSARPLGWASSSPSSRGDLERSQGIYEQLMKVFGKDENYKEQIQSDVFRGYAEVLNQLHKFQEAKPFWLRLRLKKPETTSARSPRSR